MVNLERRLGLSLLLGTVAIATTALIFLFAFEYAARLPWVGFTFSPYTGEIFSIDTLLPEQKTLLMPGDRILQIGPLAFENYVMGSRPALHSLIDDSGAVQLLVQRDNQVIRVDWVMTRLPLSLIVLRLGQFTPAIIILGVTFIALFFLRPIDRRYIVFILSYSLTSVWVAGSVVSPFNIFHSSAITRLALWMCVPLFLQTGWNFPQPLNARDRPFLVTIYLAALLFAIADFFRWLPINAFLVAITLAVVGSGILMVLHAWVNPTQRHDVRLVVIVLSLVMMPLVVGAVLTTGYQNPVMANLTYLALPGVPLAVLYTVYRRRLGGIELRVNQAFTLFLYFLVLLTSTPVLYLLIRRYFSSPTAEPVIAVMLIATIGILTAVFYPRFARWAQVALLRIPTLPDRLLQTYAGRIATSLERERLGRLLCDEILPSMLIRQAALIQIDSSNSPTLIALFGISQADVPKRDDIFPLMKVAGQYRPPPDNTIERADDAPCPWARLVLPLVVEGHTVGLCLLGRRDPDDFYSMSEFPMLQSLMDQTALALNNIEQARRLREFHQANIERHEAEQMALARTLHDEVLGQLALISINMPRENRTQAFQEAYQHITQHVRSIINGLRPATLTYGLRIAINELADEVTTQFPNAPEMEIYLTITGDEVRYAPEMEMHVYRILQQACHNAVKHGHPKLIKITGTMAANQLELSVIDDGIGFDAGESVNLTGMLTNHHFGLAGIYERAALIGAEVQIESTPGCGTKITLRWKVNGAPR